MGSSKKHKEKDRDEKKRNKRERGSDSSKKRRHNRSRSQSPSPTGDFDNRRSRSRSNSPAARSSRNKRQKEKRRHSGSDDSDVPIPKSSRYAETRPESRSPSPPPKASGDNSSLSIDDTNKIRAKLGLKPLQVESAPSRAPPPTKTQQHRQDEIEEGEHVDFDEEALMKIRDEREQEAETFWKEKQDFVHAPAVNITEKLKAEKLREKIALRREKRRLEDKLAESKGLADSDSDDDAAAWVRKQKEAVQQKLLADKKAKELDELDNEFGVGELVETEFAKQKNKAYTDRDLKGLKVLHGQDRIEEGNTVILTLQDKDVLNEDDDVLVNPNMIDDEKFEKNLENRKLRPEYNGYNVFDEIEYDSDGNLKGKGVLGKYDEEIEGHKSKGSFVIGEDTSEEARRAKIREKMLRSDKILESADSTSLRIASDFFTPDEMVKFKKPTKKKVRKVRKVLKADDLLHIDAESHPTPVGVISQKDLGSRKSKKKSDSTEIDPKSEPMDMEIDLEVDDLPAPQDIDVSDIKLEDEGDMDFQVALHKARLLKQKEKLKKPHGVNLEELLRSDENPDQSASGSIVLHATAEFCRTLGDIPRIEGADIYGDEEMDFEREDKKSQIEERGTWNEVEIDETPVDITRPADAEESTILEQEPDVAVGIAGALKVAQTKGYLDKDMQRRGGPSKMRHLQAQHYSIEDKSYEDDKFGKRDDRFISGPIMEFSEKNHYKPDFKLEYTDDDGKPISAKEAFRILSHKFHGKGSGKNKVDKKRRKVDQEKLLQHMNSTDTPLNTLELLQQRQKETHSAYVVLTGNKTAGASLSKSKH